MYSFLEDIHKIDKIRLLIGGAYIGDTLEEYGERMKRQWKNYYCFEADTDIFVELKKLSLTADMKLYNIRCWDSETVCYAVI